MAVDKYLKTVREEAVLLRRVLEAVQEMLPQTEVGLKDFIRNSVDAIDLGKEPEFPGWFLALENKTE
jgi:hypothetical protein